VVQYCFLYFFAGQPVHDAAVFIQPVERRCRLASGDQNHFSHAVKNLQQVDGGNGQLTDLDP
jgi:hypothetical protein